MSDVTLSDEECVGILAARFLAIPEIGQAERPNPANASGMGPFMSAVTLSQRECNGTLAARFPGIAYLGQGKRSNPARRARDRAIHECRHTVTQGV
jgi:hypothetical protein